jgi:hypothetical protein
MTQRYKFQFHPGQEPELVPEDRAIAAARRLRRCLSSVLDLFGMDEPVEDYSPITDAHAALSETKEFA